MTETSPTDPVNNGELDFHTDLAVGEILRRARLQNKITMEQVNHDLRLHPRIIEALETSNFEVLSGQAYVIGYVRSYANYLGLDDDKLVKLLKAQAQIKSERPVYNFPHMTRDRIAPPSWVIIGSGILLIVVLMLWSLISYSSTETDIPDVPKTLTAQLTPPPKPKIVPPQVQVVANAAPTSNQTQTMAIKAVQDSWIDVRNAQGETVFSRVLKAGEEFWVPEAGGGVYTLTSGNAGGVLIQKNGIAGSVLGSSGEVIRNYRLQ